MKTESNNGNRRDSGATEDRARGVADSSGVIRSKDEGGSVKAEISFPEAQSDCRSTTVLLAEAARLIPQRKYQASEQAEIIRLTALLEQRDAEIVMLKERLHRRLILDEATIHAGAPVPDKATREPMLSFIGRDQFRNFGARPAKRSFWSRWF